MSSPVLARHFAMWLATATHICGKLDDEGQADTAAALALAIDKAVPFLADSVGRGALLAAMEEIERLDDAAAATVAGGRPCQSYEQCFHPSGKPSLPQPPSREQRRRMVRRKP